MKLVPLPSDLGIQIRVSRLDTGISGQISLEDDQYLIPVNRRVVHERQWFTAAHEQAHFLLRGEIINASPDGIRDNALYRSGKHVRIEYEVNRLAAGISMPQALIDQKLSEFGGYVND